MLDPVQDGPTPTSTRSPGSGGGKPVEFDKGALRELVHGVVLGASALVHSYLARTDQERAEGVWLADNEDQAGIGNPVVDMAARRAGPELGNPDVADLLAAGFALGGYVVKNARAAWSLRRAHRRLNSAGPGLIEHPENPAA